MVISKYAYGEYAYGDINCSVQNESNLMGYLKNYQKWEKELVPKVGNKLVTCTRTPFFIQLQIKSLILLFVFKIQAGVNVFGIFSGICIKTKELF